MPRLSLTAAAVLSTLIASPGLRAASSSSQEAEYQQVRKIALRDPKVRAAYADADRRLEAKILQIDPSLASYVRSRDSSGVEVKTVAKKPAATPMPKQAGAKVHRRSHVVERGETLSEIALRYGVTVAALRDANKIVDDKKLAAGQVLAIPGGNATATVPAKKQSAWEQIKSSF